MSKILCCLAVVGLLILATSAQAITLSFDAPLGLTGDQEAPPRATPATGTGTVDYDSISHLLDVYLTWSGLTAPATASHIHVGSGPGTNGPVAVNFFGFPGATAGTYFQTLNLLDSTIYGAGFFANSGGTVDTAEAALVAGLLADDAYLNIHTSTFPGGEIRGDLAQVSDPIPEPGTILLLGFGAVVALVSRRRARG